jgi:hypothetical protein
VQTERSVNSRRIRVGASISGLTLDLEPSIADHVTSLVVVYGRGKECVDRTSVNVSRSTTATQGPIQSRLKLVFEAHETFRTTTSRFLLSMVFLCGQVCMHRGSQNGHSESMRSKGCIRRGLSRSSYVVGLGRVPCEVSFVRGHHGSGHWPFVARSQEHDKEHDAKLHNLQHYLNAKAVI